MSGEPAALPDAAHRTAISRELDANLLVEAGAGSGKTTELVNRMVALTRSAAATVDEMAAVTFTRKAASELRERFQDRLEEELVYAAGPERERLERALRDVDRAFVGTIHAFCARLLRERPLEAGLDPGFEETLEDEEFRRSRRFWGTWLERLATRSDASLQDLERVGLRPARLQGLYHDLQSWADVEFELEEWPPPDPAAVATVREGLDGLLDRARELLPRHPPRRGWDPLQSRLRSLLYQRRLTGWQPEPVLYDALEALCAPSSHRITQNRWADDAAGKARAKAFAGEVEAFGAEGSAAHTVLRDWWAHRYPVAVRFALRAAEAYAEHRRREGWLNFQDLLMHAARLLRENPGARADLGARYRRLLVDEFQDTDPVQAEILFLLAAPPEEGNRWSEVVPRPGQLFVVGDPKQSIYRFRRADISIYGDVRRRFRDFGGVLRLTSSFRSRPPVASLVNDVFQGQGGFPEEATEHQAPFAPLRTVRTDTVPREGVFWYALEAGGGSDVPAAEEEAERLATWIRRRTTGQSADRTPADFLVLGWNRFHLHRFARALEARNLPVQVSGAGIGAEAELDELLLLLRALADPGDGVATLAVLTGLFFGLDPDVLVAHRLAGGRFDLRHAGAEGEPAVQQALARLESWWRTSRREPADVVVGRVVEELGLVPHAAADELGQIRAGTLLYGLDAVRVAGLRGDTSLGGALEALEGALDAREAEAPLEPGRQDAVRIMNLHRAKGLEAPVVVLAGPFSPPSRAPDLHVQRDPAGGSRGWLRVGERDGFSTHTLACPRDWPAREAREAAFLDAEAVRLRYVAATRARDELVVARRPGRDDDSAWSPFHAWLQEHGTQLPLPALVAPDRERLDESGDAVRERVGRVEAERKARARPTYRFETVTAVARRGAAGDTARGGTSQMDLFLQNAEPNRPSVPGGIPRSKDEDDLHRGRDWGSAVHAALEGAARGADREALWTVARSHLLEYERPVDEKGEPVELEALLETVAAVMASPVWRRARAAARRLVEVPLVVPMDDREIPTCLDGQVDLAFLEENGWVLVDYKTDVDPAASRIRRYSRQLRAYAEAWRRATGEPVKERLILFTRTGGVKVV